MKLFCLLSFLWLTNPVDNLSLTNNPNGDVMDIISNYTQTKYFLKKKHIYLTGEYIKDYNINRTLSYSVFKVNF
jgi:hypothetical protein